MIGSSPAGPLRARRMNSKPSISGIMMSVSSASKRSPASRASACGPLAATRTVKPWARSTFDSADWLRTSSSTISSEPRLPGPSTPVRQRRRRGECQQHLLAQALAGLAVESPFGDHRVGVRAQAQQPASSRSRAE
jgi:hypothetical protein